MDLISKWDQPSVIPPPVIPSPPTPGNDKSISGQRTQAERQESIRVNISPNTVYWSKPSC